VKGKKDERLSSDRKEDPEYTPLNFGYRKYALGTVPFCQRLLSLATALITARLMRVVPVGMTKRVLTESEAINGVPQAGYSRINMATSPGLPYKQWKPVGAKGKRFLFSENRDQLYRIENSYLRKAVDEYEQLARMGKRYFSLTYLNLKDERRSLAKIAEGSTRLFDCMPLHYTIVCRKYFGAFVTAMNQHATQLPSAVGIDPEGPAWTTLFRRLNRFGGKVIAGDFKEWDGRLDPDTMMRAVDVINAWYGGSEADKMARQVILEDAIYAYSLCGNTIVFKTQGLPSGMAITADFNGLCNLLYMVTAFLKMAEDAKFSLSPDMVWDYLEMTFYGDDHVLAPHPDVQHFFNFNTLKKYFSDHRITYTDALKRGGTCPDFTQLEGETSYLKRRWTRNARMPSRMNSPIEEKSLTELSNWIRKCDDQHTALYDNLNDLKAFAYQHGEVYYDETMRKLNIALQQRAAVDLSTSSTTNWTTLVDPYDHLDAKWHDGFEN